MAQKFETWAAASKVLQTPRGEPASPHSWGGAKDGSAANEARFEVPKANISYNVHNGRMVYGIPERTGHRIQQHGFEALKRQENMLDEEYAARPGGRRHLQHQFQLHMEEKEDAAFDHDARPTKAQAYYKNWYTSADNPLNTNNLAVHKPADGAVPAVAELMTAKGTTARLYKPVDPLNREVESRYAARTMYDARRDVENAADEVRMGNMRSLRGQFTGGFVETRRDVIDLSVEYPHGAPAHVRRQVARSGVSVLGNTNEMSNLNNPFTRQGYANY